MEEEKLDQRIQLVASLQFVSRVDEWRRKQADIPSRSEAIRRLVEETLEREGF
jgi:metal-responsive CopG/Arc/MetJ family transcriptional regulator